MEVLRRRRAVRDPDVLLGGELEEALELRARVLGPVPLVPVRQEQRQPRGLPPLREAGDEELVDDDLGAVDEVAELRLPEDERVGRRDRVAVLEAETGVLGERRVVDLDRGAGVGQVLDRRVRLAGALVVQDGVPVREGPALGVLAGEPDRDALGEQARERERLGLAPVDPALAERLAPALELPQQLRVRPRSPPAARAAARSSASSRSAGTAVVNGTAVSAGIVPPSSRAARRSTPSGARARRAASSCVASNQRFGLLARQHAFLDEPRRVQLRARSAAPRSARPSAAACTPPRPARCGRSAGSRRGRRRRRGRTPAGTRARAGRPRSRPPDRRR